MTKAQMQARLVELRDEIYTILVDEFGIPSHQADKLTLQKIYTLNERDKAKDKKTVELLNAKYEEKNELEVKLGIE